MAGAGVLLVLVPVVVAGIAQTLVIRFDPWPWLAVPLDGGARWRGARLLGDHKTVRGLLVMTSVCGLASAVVMPVLLPADEPGIDWWWFGVLVGLGYVLGELPNSFVKRRVGVDAGATGAHHPRLQHVADQADSVVGVVVVVALLVPVSWWWLTVAAVLGYLLHEVVDRVLHATGVKPDAPGRAGRRTGAPA